VTISTNGFKALFGSLHHHSELKKLDINYATLSNDVVASLGELLSVNHAIRDLNLAYSKIDLQPFMRHIRVLILDHIYLSDEVCDSIAYAMQHYCLSKLILDKMSNQGRNIIASAIPQSRLVEIKTQYQSLPLSSESLQQNISLKVIKPFVSYDVQHILDRNKRIRWIV